MLIPIDMRQASRGATMTNNRSDGCTGGAPGTVIGEDGDPAPTIASSHVPAIAFDARQSDVVQYGDMSGALDTDGHTIAVAFAHQAGGGGTSSGAFSFDMSPTLQKSQTMAAQIGMHVRRFTPREFERLQGFPDDYTLIDYNGKPAADGPRYQAIGNSMPVPVMRWIGQRIKAVDAL